MTLDAVKKASPDFLFSGVDSMPNFEDQILTADAEDMFDVTTHHNYGAVFKDNYGAVQSHAMGKPAWCNENWTTPVNASAVAHANMKLVTGFDKTYPIKNPFLEYAIGIKRNGPSGPRPCGQALSVWLNFVEDCVFDKELHKDCLPWITIFNSREGDKKHAAVVFGRIRLYGGSYNENEYDVAYPEIKGDGTLTVKDPDMAVHAFDMEGNEFARNGSSMTFVLNEEPIYFTSDKGVDHLKTVLQKAKANYDDPGVQLAMHDFTSAPEDQAILTIRVENRVLNQQTVKLTVTAPENWKMEKTELSVSLNPGEVRELEIPVLEKQISPINKYAFTVNAETAEGSRALAEDLSFCIFRKGTPVVDGSFNDWKENGAIPVLINGGVIEADATEKLWFPMLDIESSDESNLMMRFAGMWDEDFFYIFAEVKDPTSDLRPSHDKGLNSLTHPAPLDYLYWGNMPKINCTEGDALKIAFQIHPLGEKDDPWLPKEAQKHIDQRFFPHLYANFEFDLYQGKVEKLSIPYEEVLKKHLSKTALPENRKDKHIRFASPVLEEVAQPKAELLRLQAPGVARHNNYPFSPKQPNDQKLINEAKLVIKRNGNTVVYECAIPWSELSTVDPKIGKAVLFSPFYMNKGKISLEWTDGKSVSSNRAIRMHPTWKKLSSLETAWGFAGSTSAQNPTAALP